MRIAEDGAGARGAVGWLAIINLTTFFACGKFPVAAALVRENLYLLTIVETPNRGSKKTHSSVVEEI